MRMLAAGIDVATISLCLGHESIDSTSAYLKSRELHQMGEPNTSLRQLVG
jgi:site-specific recombinase XerD